MLCFLKGPYVNWKNFQKHRTSKRRKRNKQNQPTNQKPQLTGKSAEILLLTRIFLFSKIQEVTLPLSINEWNDCFVNKNAHKGFQVGSKRKNEKDINFSDVSKCI